MLRRDFLKAFSAFSAAVAAGMRMPSGREVAATTPPPPAPETPLAEAKPRSIQDAVIEKLKECDITNCERVSTVAGYDRFVVTYSTDRSPAGVNLNDQVEPMIAGLRPVEIAVTSSLRDMDITHLGEFKKFSLVKPVVEIKVAWA